MSEGALRVEDAIATLTHPDSSHWRHVMAAVLRALFFYIFLIFITRIVGRRPGKQLAPFEFVLVFFMGGLALTAMVGNEASLTNSLIEIMTVAAAHALVTLIRMASPRLARLIDGTPLILLENQQWRKQTLIQKRVQDDDVMAMARDQGLSSLDQIRKAVLERNGEITIIPQEKES
jgi:uncharacterized membrane protein YcaP (DUF421 family)